MKKVVRRTQSAGHAALAEAWLAVTTKVGQLSCSSFDFAVSKLTCVIDFEGRSPVEVDEGAGWVSENVGSIPWVKNVTVVANEAVAALSATSKVRFEAWLTARNRNSAHT